MTDITSAPVPVRNAWIARDQARPSSETAEKYSVEFDTTLPSISDVSEGDWLVLTDTAGNLRRVGRIARVRAQVRGVMVYFDRTVQNPVAAGLHGLTLP